MIDGKTDGEACELMLDAVERAVRGMKRDMARWAKP